MARILVIDDDPVILELLRSVLTLDGHRVDTAPDGREGMACFREQPPDLVITDLVMPEQEGIETIRMLRRLDAAVRILAISGEAPRVKGGFLDAARILGADRALAKPFGVRELSAAVRELLDADATR